MCPCNDNTGYVCAHHQNKLAAEMERIGTIRLALGDDAAEAEMQALRGYYGHRTVSNYLAALETPA